ncbi:MAG: hypothetical protein NT026_01130 [Candidatus Staskawiczbacteria bacterium]|nr:hypothetical protein [Candidatus Staskawiczbacteria bacterium]
MTDNIQEEIEDKIIDWIALGSEGRLIAFKPEQSSNLVVQKKGGHGGKELVFKIESFIVPQEKKDFIKGVEAVGVKPAKNFYFLFVVFKEVAQEVSEKIWLVPSADFFANAEKIESKDSDTQFQFNDKKFSKYLMDRKDFDIFLIEKLISENKPKPKMGFKHKTY